MARLAPNISTLTELDKVWLAAMIDGEGTIGIYRSRRPKCRSGWRYYPVVSINNTDRRIIDRFVDLTEDWISRVRDYMPKNLNGNRIYNAEIRYKTVGTFLRQIRPYLVAKGEQADLAFEFIKLQRNVGQRNYHLLQPFNDLYIESRLLNHRGRKPLNVSALQLTKVIQ